MRDQMAPEQFKQARQKLGYTQQALADKLDMTSRAIGGMERGEFPIELRTELAVKHLLSLVS
jgi:DNA-binding XRE family transcriptional regulator